VLEISDTWVHELTDWGRDLEPIVIALGRWDSACRQSRVPRT
jgi:DNA-binding HxlR family transcriptional regulator